MPAFTAVAPAKIILFGEHAVVYGMPAIAVPVPVLQARVIIRADVHGEHGSVHLTAPAIALDSELMELNPNHPLRKAVELTAQYLHAAYIPACQITIHSTIPVAAGMGSGAAVSVALMRALAAYLGHPLSPEILSELAYEVEKIHHGNPSGIDNTVIAFEQAIYFVRDQPVQPIQICQPFQLVIADSGISSSTAQVVAEVRAAWQTNPNQYETFFKQIAQISTNARRLLESVSKTEPIQPAFLQELGLLMSENQALLVDLGVSCLEIDRLVQAALNSGAYGAKLSGGGKGGNMIALVDDESREAVCQTLKEAGASRVIVTTIGRRKDNLHR